VGVLTSHCYWRLVAKGLMGSFKIVFGSSVSAPVMSDIEFSAGLVEETVEFRRKDISDEEESPEPTKSFLKNTSRRKMFWNSGRQL